MENNKKKKHIALNCAIGALALLGSAGTITFGTLWCQSRNKTGGDVPVIEPITINLDSVETTTEPETCMISKTGLNIKKGQKIALVSDMQLIPTSIEKTDTLLFEFGAMDSGMTEFPTFYGEYEFYIDDELISPDLYLFRSSALEGGNLVVTIDDQFPVPPTFSIDKSVFKIVVTPYNDISSAIIFVSMYQFI